MRGRTRAMAIAVLIGACSPDRTVAPVSDVPAVASLTLTDPSASPVVTRLSGPANAPWATAVDVNSSGYAVGYARDAFGCDRIIIWSPAGVATDLGGCGQPHRINDANVIVGTRGTAFRWTAASGFVDLGTLGGNRSVARDINEQGWIVGTSTRSDGSQGGFLYTPTNGMRDLGNVARVVTAEAAAVTSRGQVLGRMPEGPFIWSPTGGTRILPPLTRGYRRVWGLAMSESGDVVGQDAISILGDSHATAWFAGRAPFSLGTLGCSGITFSYATSIGGSGTIVGSISDICGPTRAFIWHQETGMRELAPPAGETSCWEPRVNRRGTLAVGTCDGGAVLWRLP